jgi:hypothetical protein
MRAGRFSRARNQILCVLASSVLCVAGKALAQPVSVVGVSIDAPSPHDLALTWTPYDSADFSRYTLKWQVAGSGEWTTDTLTSQAASSYSLSGLTTFTQYEFSILVVDTADVAGAETIVGTRTLPLAYPFVSTVDFTDLDFTTSGTWAIISDGPGEGNAHTGTYHWTDSPEGDYLPSVTSSISTTIDLSTADAPMLTWWQRYSLYPNDDWGYVEVSLNGSSWTREYFVTGSAQTTWRQERLDLTPYRGNPEVRIRFLFVSNSSNQSDGWHLDDFTIEDAIHEFPYPFAESFDDSSSADNWLTSSWELVGDGRSPPYQMHDSPVGGYGLDAWSSLTLAGTISLADAVNPVLSFWNKYDIYSWNNCCESEFDYGRIYVSPDNGNVWHQLSTRNGLSSAWTKVSLDLSQFIGSTELKVRFVIDDNRRNNNPSEARHNQNNGWWIDDIRVEELPNEVFVTITDESMHNVDLSWSQNTDGDFDRYEIFRSTSTSVTRSSTLVATITNQATTTYVDNVAMIEPTHYSYAVWAVDTLTNVSPASNIVTADYSIPTRGFPFQDAMSDTTTAWAYGTPWGSTTEDFHSAPSSWTDSPGASYGRSANTALETVVNLDSAVSPVLTFWHRYAFEEAVDYGRIEVSLDGTSWSNIMTVTGIDTTWTQERIDLGQYTGDTIRLRFRLTSNGETQLDGWYIDDVAIADESRAVSFPWSDDVESGVGSWFADSPWGVADSAAHTGTYYWSDSPVGTYAPNVNSALRLTIDLSGADSPVLRFWERYSFQPNVDWGVVEVSKDGGTSWAQEYFVTGSQASWVWNRVDLSPYKNEPQVMVRFRITSNGSSQSDGWHIDDVEIVDDTKLMPYPFVDGFDDSVSAENWITSNWEFVADGRSGSNGMHDSPAGNYRLDAFTSLVTAGTMDLSLSVNPVLTFWYKSDIYSWNNCCESEFDYGRVYASPDNGQVWYSMHALKGIVSGWTKVTVDLSQFASGSGSPASLLRIRFTLDDNRRNNDAAESRYNQTNGWWIDDVRIEELPASVTISEVSNSSMHHAELNWTQNHNGDFARYEIYRATSTSVSRSSSLVHTVTDQGVTSWSDVFAVNQPTHYSYRIYVVDTLNNVSPASNVVTAPYDVPLNIAPDTLDVDQELWSWGDPWGPATNSYYTAPSSWKSGPGRAYPANANTSLSTQVNLDSTTTPVLMFHHRYAFESGVDFGRVEVSSDAGQTWSQILRVTGIDTIWSSERIDLSAYAGSTIGLRFRVTSNSETHLDGWYIDEVIIDDGTLSVTYPWTDDVEAGVGSWFAASPWGRTTVGSHSGDWHWTDSPAGSYAPNENTALTLAIDLSGALTPVLKFWQRYSFEPNNDWGVVEVSANGGASWTQLSFETGSSASWIPEKIDMSPYIGNHQTMVRFRLTSNGAGAESDGWHLDDFEIVEETHQLPYPFHETFDDSSFDEDWLTASWGRINGGRSGQFQMHDSPSGNYRVDAFSSLTMAGTVDLTNAANPVLTYWNKYDIYTWNNCCESEHDYVRVYVSPDNGQVWYSMTAHKGTISSWTMQTIDLSQFVGASEVRVRFTVDDNRRNNNASETRYNQNNGWWIDDVRIGESLTVATLADSARFEGPAIVRALEGLASPRLIGRIYEPGVTTTAGQGSGVVGEFGVGARGTMPDDSTWTWFAAGYLDDQGGADRFFGSVADDTVGVYALAFRASIDEGATWIYADLDGNRFAGGGVSQYEPENAPVFYVGSTGNLALHSYTESHSLRSDDVVKWAFEIGNTGLDPLFWEVFEADTSGATGDVPWMVIDPRHGGVPVGERHLVEITFDATGLAFDSIYAASLLFTSNDAQDDSIYLPLNLTVLPPGTPGGSGRVTLRGVGPAQAGTVEFVDQFGTAVDTAVISANGWFASYGMEPGTYRLLVRVQDAYPQEITGVEIPDDGIQVIMSSIHPLALSSFFSVAHSSNSTVDGLPMPVGTIVSVRGEDGRVSGATTVTTEGSYGFLKMYADDPITQLDEGVDIGDTVTFYVNDLPTQNRIIYSNHNDIYNVDLEVSGVAPYRLDVGLNLISLGVQPRDTSLAEVLSSIEGFYSYVAGFDIEWGGARIYVDSLQEFSDLHTLDGEHGYWIRMSQAADLTVYGMQMYDDTPIDLDLGWNLVAYLPAAPMSTETALASCLDVVDVVRGFDRGAQTYVPGSQFSDLNKMLFRHGYWIHTNGPSVLSYRSDAPDTPVARPASKVVADGGPVPTPAWMDIYGYLKVDTEAGQSGSMLSVVDSRGLVCGQATVANDGRYGFLHIYGDDPATEMDEGPVEGEFLTMMLDGEPLYGAPSIRWTGSGQVRRLDMAVSSTPTAVRPDRPLQFMLHAAYPNPFNPSTMIRYEVTEGSQVSLVVYDQLGQMIRKLVDREHTPGRYSVEWDGTDMTGRSVASGTYVLRLLGIEGTRTNRVTLVR